MLRIHTFKQTILAASVCLLLASKSPAAVIISEVAPWSSSNSTTILADWFELTNTDASPVNIAGWKMDDNSNLFANSVALIGITNIGAGESVIFLESSATNLPATVVANFKSEWFGANVPAGLQVGTYPGQGAGVGLSSGGDAVNVFDSGGALQAKVIFGPSPLGPSFPTFDNAAGLNNTTISQLSVVGVNGAFTAAGNSNEIGSPGVVPEPGSVLLLVLGAGVLTVSRAVRNRRRVRS